jgi:DNA polymerase-3 subunit delta'
MTNPWAVYGHDWAVDYLRKGMANNRIRQAYLITGAPNIGKNTLAHVFAMALSCEHPDTLQRPCYECRNCKKIISGNHSDILYSDALSDTGIMKIETVRAISSRIAMKPYEGRHKIAIFHDFDRAQPRAQDALLKTLEEPPPHAIMILLATSLEHILSTITSRSQVIQLRPVAVKIIHDVLVNRYQASDDLASLLARISGGRIGWAIQAVENPELLDQRTQALDLFEHVLRANMAERFTLAGDLGGDKQALTPLLDLWLTYWRDLMFYLQGYEQRLCNIDRMVNIEQMAYDLDLEGVISAIRATQTLLKNLSYQVNQRLALEVLFLDYPSRY